MAVRMLRPGSHQVDPMKIRVEPLSIRDVKLVRARRFADARGYFAETWVRDDFAAAGIEHDFVQDNESRSAASGTVRGLHFQIAPFAQTKLVRVLRGKVLDVVVDLRRSSESYGRHLAIELSETGDQLLVPRGFAHGFCTLERDTVVFYKVDAAYSAGHERGVFWADPALAIAWPVAEAGAIVSDKDRRLPRFRDLPVYFD